MAKLRPKYILLSLIFTFLTLSPSFADANKSECQNAVGFNDQVMTDSATKNTYKAAIIMGHVTANHGEYICVNGLKIVPISHAKITSGYLYYSKLSEIDKNVVVEVKAIPDPDRNQMMASEISLQHTVAGFVRDFGPASNIFYIMGESINSEFFRSFQDKYPARRFITFNRGYIVHGIRKSFNSGVITPTDIRFGYIDHEGFKLIPRVTGVLRSENIKDFFDNRFKPIYVVGDTRVKTMDEKDLIPYVGKHVSFSGVWHKDRERDYLQVKDIVETPFTSAYQPVDVPTYISVEGYFDQDGPESMIYNLKISPDVAEIFIKNNKDNLENHSEFIMIGTGTLTGNGPVQIDHLNKSLLSPPTLKEIISVMWE